MKETQRIRLPDAKRRLVSGKYHYSIALDEDTGETIGTAGWLIPSSDNARHHLRRITLYERILGIAYRIYDAGVSIIPHKLYALFCPEGAARLQRQVQWRAEMAKCPEPDAKSAHEKVGYWHLSFMCESTQQGQTGYPADESIQVWFPNTPVEG